MQTLKLPFTIKLVAVAFLSLILSTRCSVGQSPLLPQDHAYQVALYEWLSTVTVEDVHIPEGVKPEWDGFYENTNQLAFLWAQVERDGDNDRGYSTTVASEPKWYVLDDGNGYGIEGFGRSQGTNEVHLPRRNDRSGGYFGLASEIAWWYQFDLPVQNGGQGNPLYKHKGAGNRALVIAMVDMMMLQRCIETLEPNCTNNWGKRTDFIGGYLISSADAIHWAGEMLDQSVREAFFNGMEMLVDEMIELGAHDVNSNMDGKAVEGCALADKAAKLYAPNHSIRKKCVDLSRLVLFGYTDGQIDPEVKIDSDKGIFFLEGLIREADGPETTYNGRSFAHLAAAKVATSDNVDWGFMDGVIKRMCSFMFHQYYERPLKVGDPDAPAIRTVVPDGYSNRTPGGMERLQSTPWANLSMAYYFEECRPFAVNYERRLRENIPSPDKLERSITQRIAAIDEYSTDTEDAQSWAAKEPWPTITPFVPNEEDWYTKLREINDTDSYLYPNHSKIKATYSKTFPEESEAGENWWDKPQWWARKDGESPNQFSYFIEATVYSGVFGGYYSGKVEAFWREEQGPVILSRREPLKIEYEWEGVDKWRVEHVWGYDENDKAFSWAKVKGVKDQEHPLARTSTWDGAEQRMTLKTPIPTGRGQEVEGTLTSGGTTHTKIFQGLTNGLEVITRLENNSSDEIKELWMTIPVYEGGREGDHWILPDKFQVDYFSNGEWIGLDENIKNADHVRIGHDWGRGIYYTYLTFSKEMRLRLIPADQELDWEIIHLLQIDLHGNPGNIISFPSDIEFSYSITTSSDVGENQPTSNEGNSSPEGGFSLHQNFPNPFREATTLEYEIPSSSHVEINVYDLNGRLIETLVNSTLPSGNYNLTWDATGKRSGLYVVRMRTEHGNKFKYMTLLN